MYCRKCGNQISDSASFCPRCGIAVASPVKPRNIKSIVFICCGISLVIVLVFVGILKKDTLSEGIASNDIHLEDELDTVEEEMSLREQLEEAIAVNDAGKDKESQQRFEEIMEENYENPEAWLTLAELAVEKEKINLAKEYLLMGFEQTEDERLMEEFLDISVAYVEDENGEEYEILLGFVELYAEATDNEDKLEVAKKVYFYYQLGELY